MPVNPDRDTVELPILVPPAGPGPIEFAGHVLAALELARAGDRHAARAGLTALWRDYGPGVSVALPRALLAHHLAGLHEDPGENLRWNQRALQAATWASDSDLADWGLPIPARALFPLLHLRLARAHHRAGHLTASREHLHQARTWAPALPRDAYGERVRSELNQLSDHLNGYTPPSGTHRAR